MGIYRQKNSSVWWVSKRVNGRLYRQSSEETAKMRAVSFYERWVVELKESVKSGKPVPTARTESSVIRFFELCGKYIEWCDSRHAGIDRKQSLINKFKLFFGDRPLNEFSYATVDDYQGSLINDGCAISYVNKNLSVFKAMFHWACERELIDEAQYKKILKVKQLKGENERLEHLTLEEEEMLISCCDPHLRPIVIMALDTGMRQSEILRLTWDRIKMDKGLILLDVNTKSRKRRELPMSDRVHDTLLEINKVRLLKCNFVFYNPKTLRPYDEIKKSWATALKRSRILDAHGSFHFHDLRHTFATKIASSGKVSLTTLKEILGHKSFKMTFRYAHFIPSAFQDARDVLNGLNKKSVHSLFIVDENKKISEL